MFDGDLVRATERMAAAVEFARASGDRIGLSWFLAYLALPVFLETDADGIPIAREALALARSTGSTVALLYPLLALMTDTEEVDPEQSLAAAEELVRLDRTKRQTYVNLARGLSAILLIRRGEVADGHEPVA